jgi:ABC-type Mn2+/Zn2+ transport system permease subunit
MMLVGAGFAAVSAPAGLLVSWHFDVAAGASIVLVAVGIFLGVLLLRTTVVAGRSVG